MYIAKQASKLSLPQINPGVSTVLEFLIRKFPSIPPAVWRQRVNDGKVHLEDGTTISVSSPFQPQLRVFYYREVIQEPVIPFNERILFEDQHLMVAYKPHFLPVTPGGNYVNECLQNRLRMATENSNLQSLHRIDRVTAGIVLFSKNISSRHQYHQLFATQQVDKSYQAIARINDKAPVINRTWTVKSRLQNAASTSPVRATMQVVEGVSNSHSRIKCIAKNDGFALFDLKPVTGKTHQLRVHMKYLGWPIVNDTYYPKVEQERTDDFSKPLQLLAKTIGFTDPITGHRRRFTCPENLNFKAL